MRDWEPLGIADVPAAADEYDPYARHLAVMIAASADPAVMAGYLTRVEADEMGLAPDPVRAMRVAERLLR